MNRFRLLFFVVSCFLFPSLGHAQTIGRVECARSDGYVYLYSSMTTLDVRTTLQCGELVQISGRYETYFSVSTSKGEAGYIPIAALTVLKDQVGTGLPPSSAAPPARERTPYDERPAAPPAPAAPAVPPFTLLKGTPVHVRIRKPLSSSSAHIGDAVEFEVLDDVLLDGVVVIARKLPATSPKSKPKNISATTAKFPSSSLRFTWPTTNPPRCVATTKPSAQTPTRPVPSPSSVLAKTPPSPKAPNSPPKSTATSTSTALPSPLARTNPPPRHPNPPHPNATDFDRLAWQRTNVPLFH